jgi:hypothetical protein
LFKLIRDYISSTLPNYKYNKFIASRQKGKILGLDLTAMEKKRFELLQL